MKDNNVSITDVDLFKLLKGKIYEIWKEKGLIQYHSLGTSIINDIVCMKPHTYEELLLINGIGEYKANIYGKEILKIINKYYPNSQIKNIKPLKFEKLKEISNKVKGKKNSYKYWESLYPGYIIIKKEGFFWSIRGSNAELVGQLTGFRVGDNRGSLITGCPSLEFIRDILISNGVPFVVIENNECIEKWN